MVLPQNQLGSDSEQQTVLSQATKIALWFFIGHYFLMDHRLHVG
jgi:hypothetical protein